MIYAIYTAMEKLLKYVNLWNNMVGMPNYQGNSKDLKIQY